MKRTTLHIIDGDSRSRAEQARIVFALGHHAEVHADLDELLERPPHDGIVIAASEGEPGETNELIRRLGASGLWLPVVMASSEPSLEQVVDAIKSGALDFVRLPLEMGSFARRLAGILAEAGQHAERRRRQVEAQHTISLLSRREREVLELLSAGCSNKEIAHNLAISPRTVEIHRGNMMLKLGAGHAADAVRLWMEAHQEDGFGKVAALSDGRDRNSARPLRAHVGAAQAKTTLPLDEAASDTRVATGSWLWRR